MVTKAPKEKYTCGCGNRVTRGYEKSHEAGDKHREWAELQSLEEAAAETQNLIKNTPEPEGSDPHDLDDLFTANGQGDAPIPVVISKEPPLDPELQTVLDSNQSLVNKAKSLRRIFSVRNWPSSQHPGTIKDFMDEYAIPYHETFSGSDATATGKSRVEWEKAQVS